MTEKSPSARVKLNDLLFNSEPGKIYVITEVAQQLGVQPATLEKILIECELQCLINNHAPEKNQFRVTIQPGDGSISILPPDRR